MPNFKETLYISMQLIENHVDDSSGNNSTDAHSNEEPDNHESSKRANGPHVSVLKPRLNDSLTELLMNLFMREFLKTLIVYLTFNRL